MFPSHRPIPLPRLRTQFAIFKYSLREEGFGYLGLWHINLCRLFNAKSVFIQIQFFFKQFTLTYKTVPFQNIQLSEHNYADVRSQFNGQKYFYFRLFSLVKQF